MECAYLRPDLEGRAPSRIACEELPWFSSGIRLLYHRMNYLKVAASLALRAA